MTRDELLLGATSEINSLVETGAADTLTAQTMLELLDAIVQDDQPTPQITLNANIGAIDVNWLVNRNWAVLLVTPDGVWSFWLDNPDGEPVYELDDRSGEIAEEELNEIQRILGMMGQKIKG